MKKQKTFGQKVNSSAKGTLIVLFGVMSALGIEFLGKVDFGDYRLLAAGLVMVLANMTYQFWPNLEGSVREDFRQLSIEIIKGDPTLRKELMQALSDENGDKSTPPAGDP